MFPNSRKKKTDTSACRRGVFFLCLFQSTACPLFCRFHLRPHHSSWNREPCGYARFRGFRRPSFDTPLTLLSFRTLLSHFSDAPHARRCIASCILLSFPADGRRRCPAHTGRRWHASRSIHDGCVREALRGLTGCRLFRERKRGTAGLSFVSCDISTCAVHAVALCFGGVRGAPLVFPWYRGTSAPVLEALWRCQGGVRLPPVSEASERRHGSFLCIRELRRSQFWKCRGDVREAFLPAAETRTAIRRAPARGERIVRPTRISPVRPALHSAAYSPPGQGLHARATHVAGESGERLRSVYDIQGAE